MRLFIDVDKNVVLQGAANAVTGVVSYVPVKKGYIVAKRGGSMAFELYPVHSDMLPALVDSRLIFGIKKAGVFDGDYLAGAVAAKAVDAEGVMMWRLEVVFSSLALDAALCVDSDVKNDLASVDCGAELSWQMDGGVACSSSVFPVVVQNNINRDLEPPPALLPTYPLATEIALRADLERLAGSWDGGNVANGADFRGAVTFWSKVGFRGASPLFGSGIFLQLEYESHRLNAYSGALRWGDKTLATLEDLSGGGGWDAGEVLGNIAFRGEVHINDYSSSARLRVDAPATFNRGATMSGAVSSAGGISFSAPSGSYVKLAAGEGDKLYWGGKPVAMEGSGAWDGGVVNGDATFKGSTRFNALATFIGGASFSSPSNGGKILRYGEGDRVGQLLWGEETVSMVGGGAGGTVKIIDVSTITSVSSPVLVGKSDIVMLNVSAFDTANKRMELHLALTDGHKPRLIYINTYVAGGFIKDISLFIKAVQEPPIGYHLFSGSNGEASDFKNVICFVYNGNMGGATRTTQYVSQ